MIFDFDIKPMAKQSMRMGNGRSYQPTEVLNYHNALRFMARDQMLRHGWVMLSSVPIRVKVVAMYRIPKSRPASIRDHVAGGFTIPKTTKPDVDNLLKATLDALKGTVFEDDALISEASVSKREANINRLIVTVEAM